jgi:chemotaxis protein methyltransferase CheR
MKIMVSGPDIERFGSVVARRLGLQFGEAQSGFLEEVLQRRLAAIGASGDAYLGELEAGLAAPEIAALARELTVGETYFFRNQEQFRALSEIALPQRMQARAGEKALRILSAGCASGEEAYSIAILTREAIPDTSWDIAIRAVDINPAALQRAACGRYSSWALRETPPEIQHKWFRADGRELILDETVRARVCFEERNLACEDEALWQPQSFDVVFCRNVTMYFAPEQARALLTRIARALHPGGYLFLGHAETLRTLSEEFHLRHTHGTFYYQRKAGAERGVEPPAPAIAGVAPAAGSVAGFGDAWVEVIRSASERVAALVSAPRPARQTETAGPPLWDLAPVFELLRTERFGEALAAIRGLPAASARDPDVLLLTATLLAHSGEARAAEEACRGLLLIDDLNAGAHYVFALCREAAGDRAGAVEHDQMACYLDAGFAMPRLHLGLLARRAGDREAARHEFVRALMLLKREDPSRLLLFGGGFNRGALLALCETALRDCGGEP